MRRRIIAVIFAFGLMAPILGQTNKKTAVVDIPAIAGKSPAEVERVLGPPYSRGQTNQAYPRLSFQNPTIEVVFVTGKAERITIWPKALPYKSESLAALGLPARQPTYSNLSDTIRWEKIAGLKAVSFFPGERDKSGSVMIWYAYVEVFTSP